MRPVRPVARAISRSVTTSWVDRIRAALAGPVEARLAELAVRLRQLELAALRAEISDADPRSLARHGYRCFSQNDEDGLIDEIFRRVGTTDRRFVEFGVEGGAENNTLALLVGGWRGLWIEADGAAVACVRDRFASAMAEGRLALLHDMVTAENIEELLARGGVPDEPDLLSIDIDGNDYWVWRAIRRVRPRVVVIEYNASLGRTARVVRPYDPAARWDGTAGFGASLGALEALGREKGYALVGCNLTGVNAFFVREELAGDRFEAPFTAVRHFRAPRFGATGAGHPAAAPSFVEV